MSLYFLFLLKSTTTNNQKQPKNFIIIEKKNKDVEGILRDNFFLDQQFFF